MDYSDLINQANQYLEAAERQLQEARERARLLSGEVLPDGYDDENLKEFIKQPYVLQKRKENEFLCFVPRFVNFQVGWLERTTVSYNIFVLNQYTNWLGELPPEIAAQTGLNRPPED